MKAPIQTPTSIASHLAWALWLGATGCLSGGDNDGPVALEMRLGASQEQVNPLVGPGPNHLDRLLALREAAQDDTIKGLLLQVGPLGGSWARAEELATAAAQVRAAGKPVHCHVRTSDNVGYALLATACDRISMTPGGTLDLVGVRAEVIYARELLERLGLRAELLQAGRFKGAADPLTRDDMPETTRTTLNAILDGLRDHQFAALEHGRSVKPDRAQALIDEGPFTAHRARLRGLVDDVGFDDEARQHLRKAAAVDRIKRFGAEDEASPLAALIAILRDGSETSPSKPYLAVVNLDGAISDAGGEASSASRFVPHMRKLADDERCKAVVLRIDSPGGSALASDRMWHAVRRVKANKPVVVSIGDMAASGGYYIASAATTVLASDISLVGSIGVVGGKVEFSDLANRSGVHSQRLTRGKNAAWSSPFSPWNDGERLALRGLIDATYRLFLKRVGQGRELTPEAVEPMAEGRLMLAKEGRRGKLVDAAGGFLDAIERARAAGELEEAAPMTIWPESQSPLERMLTQPGGAARAPTPELAEAWLEMLDPSHRFAALRVMLAGERLAAAAPYTLLFR